MTDSATDEVVKADPPIVFGKGNPTDEEIGAAMAVLAIATAPRPKPRAAKDRPVAGGWASYWRTIRRDHRPGHGAWTARF